MLQHDLRGDSRPELVSYDAHHLKFNDFTHRSNEEKNSFASLDTNFHQEKLSLSFHQTHTQTRWWQIVSGNDDVADTLPFVDLRLIM